MVNHAERLWLQSDSRWLACSTDTSRPGSMTCSGAGDFDLVGKRTQRRKEWWSRTSLFGRYLAEIRMVWKVFNVILLLVPSVIRLKWHAIITHAFCAMFTELGIPSAGYFSVSCTPIAINRIFFHKLPRTFSGISWIYNIRSACGDNRRSVAGRRRRAGLICRKNQVSMTDFEGINIQVIKWVVWLYILESKILQRSSFQTVNFNFIPPRLVGDIDAWGIGILCCWQNLNTKRHRVRILLRGE